MNASLVIIGTGIKFLSHLTKESQAYIEKSEKVLYLVNEPAMKQWIQKANAASETLDFLYSKYPRRLDCYNAITEYILNTLRKQKHVCAVFYGHPTIFAQPGLEAVKQAQKEGYFAKILPAVSAADCLYADLQIDPGASGCQSFDATDFLIYNRQFDPSSHLILWQVDIIGILNNPEIHNNNHGASVLVKQLNKYYSLEHEIILYEAAQYPFFESKIQKIPLHGLPNADFSRITTLYVPPGYKAKINLDMANILNMNIDNH